jgi:hypothetical protein
MRSGLALGCRCGLGKAEVDYVAPPRTVAYYGALAGQAIREALRDLPRELSGLITAAARSAR